MPIPTLLHLAKRDALATISVVDYRDFDTYRIEGRRRFRLPDAPSSALDHGRVCGFLPVRK
ncbi:MAG TPA: hypothetical protein VMH05_13420 [Bryobacteraceae bacterium]|nr:hypothetical protein [Bryobacteraceae bacterium]